MFRKIRVIAGPYRTARRYAERRGWADDDYLIVCRGHQLARLDPALIGEIIVIRLAELGTRIQAEIVEQIQVVKSLWPVRIAAA